MRQKARLQAAVDGQADATTTAVGELVLALDGLADGMEAKTLAWCLTKEATKDNGVGGMAGSLSGHAGGLEQT